VIEAARHGPCLESFAQISSYRETEETMKATELLEKQHRKVEQLLNKLEAGRADPETTLQELAQNLAGHMAIEQEIFYPAARAAAPDVVAECYEEHAIAELALNRLVHTAPDGEAFHARVKSLKELVLHHVQEEEEQLLPQIDERMSEEESSRLAKQMKARFQEVIEAGYEAMLPKTPSKATGDKRPKRPPQAARAQAH
jgi:hypothetical protein